MKTPAVEIFEWLNSMVYGKSDLVNGVNEQTSLGGTCMRNVAFSLMIYLSKMMASSSKTVSLLVYPRYCLEPMDFVFSLKMFYLDFFGSQKLFWWSLTCLMNFGSIC
jgi:hypothetical protein